LAVESLLNLAFSRRSMTTLEKSKIFR